MAGDIGIREQLVILPPGATLAAAPAARAIAPGQQGQTVHSYGPRVAISTAPSGQERGGSLPRALLTATVLAEEEAPELPDEIRASLSPAERMGVDAFALRQSEAYASAKAARRHAEADWDSGVAQQPGCHVFVEESRAARSLEAGAEAGAPTSQRLTGSVAVGLIIVEGPGAALKFSAAERVKVVAEVQNGLAWMGTQNPEGVTFNYDIKVVTLTVPPGPDSLSFDQKETLWRDPAMAKLGYGTGMAGVTAYVENLRSTLHTTWAYCAFFTKYPLGWFAYASVGGPRLVMDYANDGWGPDNIDRVFTHESGHIFGAPDEYASSGCSCGGSWGFYGKPNGNCANCAPGGGVDCLMKGNTWGMCSYTPYHLGFPLVAATYTGVWRQGSDAYYLWVNASWDSFKAKWTELAAKNLRLIDLKIARVGTQDRYYGVWRAGTGAHYLWVNATWDSFNAKWQELSKLNLRLVDLEVMNTPAGLRYTGVWLPGTGAHYLWVNATWDSFKAKWEELSAKGVRLRDISITQVGTEQRFSGVFVAGTGAHYLWVNATWDSFKAKWEELGKAGLRLVDIEVVQTGAGLRYTGVWLPGTDGYYLWANTSWQSFRAKWEELAAQNLRLVDIDVTIPAGASSPVAPAPGEAPFAIPVPPIPEPVAGGVVGYQLSSGPQWMSGDDGEGGGEMRGATAGPGDAGDGYGGGDLGAGSRSGADDEQDGYGGGDLGAAASSGPRGAPADEDGYGGGDLGTAALRAAGSFDDDGAGYGGGDTGTAPLRG